MEKSADIELKNKAGQTIIDSAPTLEIKEIIRQHIKERSNKADDIQPLRLSPAFDLRKFVLQQQEQIKQIKLQHPELGKLQEAKQKEQFTLRSLPKKIHIEVIYF